MSTAVPPEGSGSGPERRRAPRIEPGVPLEARGAANWRIHDISRSGVALDIDGAMDIGTVLDLELIDLPTGLSCPFRARVVWCNAGQPGRAGLEFVEMTREQDGWLASRFVEWITDAAGF
jgi:PilZ domain